MARPRRQRQRRIPEPRQGDGIARRYFTDLLALLRDLEGVVRESFLPRLDGFVVRSKLERGRLDDTDDEVEELLTILRSGATPDRARIEERLRQIAGDMDQFNSIELQRQLRALFGADVFAGAPSSPKIQATWVKENVRLVRSLQSRFWDDMARVVGEGFSTGLRSTEIAKQIRERFKTSRSNARRIARDQVGKLNGLLTRERQEAAGITEFIWRNSRDGRVRPLHRSKAGGGIAGRKFSWEKGHPTERFPGWPVNCFPGTTRVSAVGLRRLYRYRWSGHLVEIDLGDRVILTTPNHPVLTARGWVPACEIDKSDYVLRTRGDVSRCCDDQASHSQLGKLDDLFEVAVSRRLVAGEFHGDAPVDEDVNVVDVEGMLGVDREPGLAERLGQLVLADPDEPGPRLGARAQSVIRDVAAAHRSVRLGGPGESLGGGGPSHPRVHRGGTIAHGDSGLPQPPLDHVTGDAAVGRDLLERCPGLVVLAQVLEVRRGRMFDGHVYNLETESGIYIADSAVVSNCRCTAEPVLPEELALSDDVLAVTPAAE